MSEKEAELITVSTKGQVVIPRNLRNELKIKPQTKLLVYGYRDTIVFRKIKMPKLYKNWADIFSMVEKKGLELTTKAVRKEIESYRKEKLKMKK